MIGELKLRNNISTPIWIMPILESALGIENAFADRLPASQTLQHSPSALRTTPPTSALRKRPKVANHSLPASRLVNAAHAAGVQAIDSVFGDVADMDGLRPGVRIRAPSDSKAWAAFIPRRFRSFTTPSLPPKAEIEKAQKIVAAFEDAQQKGLGVVSLGSKMIDPPVVNRAVKLVDRAKAMG